jgi:ABC-type amino acid transport substrate-binding protein
LGGLILAAAFALPAAAQDANVGALSGTLKKIKDTGTITLGTILLPQQAPAADRLFD